MLRLVSRYGSSYCRSHHARYVPVCTVRATWKESAMRWSRSRLYSTYAGFRWEVGPRGTISLPNATQEISTTVHLTSTVRLIIPAALPFHTMDEAL